VTTLGIAHRATLLLQGWVRMLSRTSMRKSSLVPAAALLLTGCLDESSNLPPIIEGSPPTEIVANTPYSFQPTASDPNGDPLTFMGENLPGWAAVDSVTGMLAGLPTDADVGETAEIVLAVMDRKVRSELRPFRIRVNRRTIAAPVPTPPPAPTPPPSQPTNRPPLISGTPVTVTSALQTYAFQPAAADPDGNVLTFSIVNRPNWTSFSTSTGRLSGTPAAGDTGMTAGIIIAVSDGTVSVALPAFSLQVIPRANQAPTLSGSPAGAITVGTAFSFEPSASDPDGDPVTFSITNRPAWTTFSASTGRLSGTPSAAQIGSYSNIVISASDGAAVTALPTFSLTVQAAQNRAPTISGSPATSVAAGSTYSFTPSASDPDGNPLTFSIAGRPVWATFSTSTGRLTGTPSAAQVGTSSGIVIGVSDGTATTSLPAFAVRVDPGANRAPVISGQPPTSIVAGQAYSFQPSASDADGDTLTFAIVNRPAWLTFNAQTGRLSGTPTASDVGTFANIAIAVSDGQANVALTPFTVLVTGNATASGTATLRWTAPTENEDGTPLTNLAGFRVFVGASPSSLARVAELASAGASSYGVTGLASGTHYFSVRAYNNVGVESNPSPAVSKTIP